jgi:hypothetical protein
VNTGKIVKKVAQQRLLFMLVVVAAVAEEEGRRILSMPATLSFIVVALTASLVFCSVAVAKLDTTVEAATSSPNRDIITVQTDKPSYTTPDKVVKVTGHVGKTIILTDKPPEIRVTNPEGLAYRFGRVQVGNDGNYSYAFGMGGRLAISGAYKVAASYGNATANTVFLFKMIPEPTHPPHLSTAHTGENVNTNISTTNNFGNRKVALSVRTTPSVIVSGSNSDILLQFRLYGSKTNETIKYPTLNIAITEGNDTKSKPLLQDFFQSENGLLKLKIHPQAVDNITVMGNREPFLGALKADPGGTVNINGPLFLNPGIYRIHIEVFGTDYPTNIFADEDVRQFDSLVQVQEGHY